LDLSGSLGVANSGFTKFYYGIDEAGPHDASITASLPIAINDNWSMGVWITYSGLLGDGIRASQFQFEFLIGVARGEPVRLTLLEF
jgi:outer membrane scaffolding protein for murein synthesis (MipA/OmpV family)